MPEITQENFRSLLPGKIAMVAAKLAENQNCTHQEALLKFYYSAVYRDLEREETKTWRESPLQLYIRILD
ncbi:MAG: hypothetical protein LBJ25_08520 [Candidatus Margulisbacteria bacterium]|jgi:hypothetical protein|nr:hypothetical protein [Candidatus Margulisiibacteriota bacterium]